MDHSHYSYYVEWGPHQWYLPVDVTPVPYNQPPYPPAGDSDSSSCTVVANAP